MESVHNTLRATSGLARRCTVVLVLLLVPALGLGGCKNYEEDAESRTVGEFTDDATIQLLVKKRLLGDPDVKGLRINVDVRRRVVTLHGRVRSETELKRALEIAAGVPKVERVVDRLYIP